MSKTNEKNIIWNNERNNTNTGFMSIEIPDSITILQHKITGRLITVNKEQQQNELVNARPCYHTDINWKKPKWFYDEFYGNNNIKMNNKVICRHKNVGKERFIGGFTLGQALKKINKIEFLFPEETEISLTNNFYYQTESGDALTLGLKYKTNRKFQGFTSDGFQMNDPRLFDNFENDKILADLVSFLRSNGFIFFVDDYDASYYNQFGDVPGKSVCGYGHGLIIGISEFNNHYNGYTYGKKNILFDKDDCFNKWSQCIEIPKPKDKSEFENILKTLIEFDYDKIED